VRRGWIDDGRVSADEPGLRRASTRLLLVAEHTWGMDQKTHWPDTVHWSESELERVRDDPGTRAFEASWDEQRRLLDEFVGELDRAGHTGLAADAAEVLAGVRDVRGPQSAPLDGPAAVEPGEAVSLGPWRLVVDETGAVVSCTGADGRQWASPSAPLVAMFQQTVDAADYERWFTTYNASTTEPDEWWARWDNTKPGLESSGARSAVWPTEATGVRCGEHAGAPVLVIDQRVSAEPDDPVAVPRLVRTTLRWDDASSTIGVELSWSGLGAARWPGATWWRVAPIVDDPDAWTMCKLGEPVSPLEVVEGGGRRLHVADRLTHPEGVQVRLMDTGLVSPGQPRMLVWDDTPVDLSEGWHVCVLANLWGTNFPMWIEGSGRCRVELMLPT
jgi:hypothetical protein